MNEPTVDIKTFMGLRNRVDPERLAPGELTQAKNIDLDDSGLLRIRPGLTQQLSFTSLTAAFATKDESRAFVIDNNNLILIRPDLTKQTLQTGMSAGYIYWLEIEDYIILSTGEVIDVDNNVSSWLIDNPTEPKVTVTSGSLRAGQYQITSLFRLPNGREGGAAPVMVIDLPDNSGLSIEPELRAGMEARVYISEPDGSELYLYNTVTSTLVVTDLGKLSYPLDQEQLYGSRVPVAGGPLALYENRLYTTQFDGRQTVIRFSRPFWWNLFLLYEDFLVVSGEVTMLAAHRDGLIIATDDEIYAYNGSLARLADYGTPKGVPYHLDDYGLLHIWSNQGLCRALPFENTTEEKVSVPPGNLCHMKLVEQNGFKKLIVITDAQGSADNKLL